MSSSMMRVRALAAVALCAMMATAAAAQSGSTTKKRARPATSIPIGKEPIKADTAAPRADTVPTPAPAPAPVATTTPTYTPAPVAPPMRQRHYGNGFYVGLAGGAGLPAQEIRNGYNNGYAIEVPIGYDAPGSPLGVRANLGYTRFDARTAFRNTNPPVAATIATGDPQLWSAMADLKLRIPFFGSLFGPTSGIYAVGGGGVNHFRNYSSTFARTNPEFNNTSTTVSNPESMTQLALEAGGGISWGFRESQLFLESRYVTSFMPNGRASYVPIVLGINFY
jgi:opacity protein-like surface antigen